MELLLFLILCQDVRWPFVIVQHAHHILQVPRLHIVDVAALPSEGYYHIVV
jgi:hypothetical protein